EALRSLVERYGCIVGYPDRTFRGNRALTRWEFAAGLNACLNTMERLLQENVAILEEDLDILKQLAEEFQQELASFGARVDNLESRVSFLEDHQFSTTTKLSGLTSFYVSTAWRGKDIIAEGANAFSQFNPPRDENNRPNTRIVDRNPQATLSYLTWINLDTSFSGRDNLRVQFAAGNGTAPANEFLSAGYFNSSGTPFLLQTGASASDRLTIRDLYYTFPATDNLEIAVGPRIQVYRYFDNNRYTFFLNGAESFNSSGSTQFSPIDRGTGAVISWRINDIFQFKTGYVGNSTEFLPPEIGASAADPARGLFGGTYNITAELDIAPTDNLSFRLLYNRSRLEPNPFDGFIGGAIGEPLPYGLADDGFGGALRHAFANAYIFNFDWAVFEKFGLFGRYSWGSTNLTPVNAERGKGHVNSQSVQLGFALPDVGKEGAQATFSYLIPFSVVSGREFLVSGGGDGSVQYEFEANYFYPVTNNIAIVPSFYVIVRPNNFGSNGPIYVGNFRTQFSF
ncbi:MAG: iron uptake porin, partial [Microcystaceae cyanobacterium]